MSSAVALIGARSGSERVPEKNIRRLAGHPLLAYAIETARQAGVFERIVVSTDSEAIAKVARWYGADVPFLRPADGLRGDALAIGDPDGKHGRRRHEGDEDVYEEPVNRHA